MRGLARDLERMFGGSRTVRRQPGRYLAVRGPVETPLSIHKVNGVWRVVGGEPEVSSVLLSEVSAQLRELGYRIERAS